MALQSTAVITSELESIKLMRGLEAMQKRIDQIPKVINISAKISGIQSLSASFSSFSSAFPIP